MKNRSLWLVVGLGLISFTLSFQGMDKVEIKTHQITNNIYWLEGRGGNIGLCVGEKGAFMIDDQFAPLTAKIKKAIEEVTKHPVQFLVNTHWHGDHTGGNENFGKSGTVIVAHENVRKRMSMEQVMKDFGRTVPAAPAQALPVITFPQEMTFYWNGEEIHVLHVKNAHTDGDAIIHFKKSNVFHMGDVFFNKRYPYIDASSGGNILGMIAACNVVLDKTNNNSKIIPGHGPLASRTDLLFYRDMLQGVSDKMLAMMKEGRSLEEIQNNPPTKGLDPSWGTGFMKEKKWIEIVYNGLRNHLAQAKKQAQ